MRIALFALLLLSDVSLAEADGDLRGAAHFRRPVAAVSLADGRLVAVAHRDSGSVSLIETAGWTVVSEQRVGKQLADLVAIPGSTSLLAVDAQANELIVLARNESEVTVQSRLPVAQSPVSLAVGAEGRTVSIASLWARRLTFFDVESSNGSIALVKRSDLSLPFAPRLQCVLDDRRLVVADSFGGQLAIVDVPSGRLEAVREIPGHNIRGLALSPNKRDLYLTHQFLEQYAPTTYDSIHWGNLMENLIRVLPIDALLNPELDPVSMGRAMPFGTTGDGAGDPAGLAFIANDRMIAVSSGTDRAQTFPTLHLAVDPHRPPADRGHRHSGTWLHRRRQSAG